MFHVETFQKVEEINETIRIREKESIYTTGEEVHKCHINPKRYIRSYLLTFCKY